MDTNYVSIDEIRRDFNNGVFSYHEDVPKAVKDDHIWDEDKSVRENREMTAKHNQMVLDSIIRVRKKDNDLFKSMRDAVVQYIMNTTELSKELADKVESYVYIEKHSCMSDYFSSIDEMADFAEEFYLAGKQG